MTGGAAAGLRYLEDGGANTNLNDTVVDVEIDFNIVASGVSDSGIAFGASVDLDAAQNDQLQAVGGGANDPEVYISTNGLSVTFGGVGTQNLEGIADVGYQGTGADDNIAMTDTGAYDVNLAYSMSGLGFGVFYSSDSEDAAVSVTGTAGTVGFGLGYTSIEGGSDFTELTLATSMGGVDFDFAFVDENATVAANDLTAFGLSASYTMGSMTYIVAMSDTSTTNQDPNFGIGFPNNLGGGLTFAGGVTSVGATTANSDATTRADLGFNMAF